MKSEMVSYAVHYAMWLGVSILLTLVGAGKIAGETTTRGRRIYLVIGLSNTIACIVSAVVHLPT